MKKSLSQKIARTFEIVSFVLLLPGVAGTVFMLGGGLFSPLLWLALIVPIAGFILLIGYFKHSRGTIVEERIFPLWIGTFLYNLMFLLPTVVYFYNQYTTKIVSYYSPSPLFNIFLGFLIMWWVTAIILSIIAIRSEVNESYNYYLLAKRH